jgi:thioredoxin-related protein
MATYSIVLVTLMTVGPLSAQEVQWRYDYTAARREAKEKQRPIVMDFGTSNCFWCKKLDASTFRDPSVVRQLNEQFIPVKIDAEREPGLVQSLRIQSYPTLVFAAPDGRILGSHVGFVEVARFSQQLNRALKESALLTSGQTAPPQQLAVSGVPSSQGQRCLVRTTAPPASPLNVEQAPEARELLSLAHRDYREKRFLSCLERCTILTSICPDSVEADEARQLTLKIKHDPAINQLLCQQLADQLGELYLANAAIATCEKDHQRAAIWLKRVLLVAPGTMKAQTARIHLDQIRSLLANQSVPTKTVRGQSPQ